MANILDPKNIGGFVTIVLVAALLAIVARTIFDNNFLTNLGKIEIARGLITSLISIGVIGIAIVIITANYTNPPETVENHDYYKEKFNRGKDILALLMGLLGTIVGFYFGSTNITTPSPLESPSPTPSPLISPSPSPTPSP